MSRLLTLLVASIMCAAEAGAQASITGVVKDSLGKPLRGALVTVDSLNKASLADAQGRYFLGNLPPGTHTLRARLFGYEPVDAELEFKATSMDTLDFELVKLPAQLDTVRVADTSPAKPATDNPRSGRDVINVEDLADGHYENVYDALAAVRPTWLTARNVQTFDASRAAATPIVYIDAIKAGSTEELKTIKLNTILRIQHFNGPEAQARWGIGHGDGVILIETIGKRDKTP
ncbi:MAG: carboxypeptidase regulatory-like domain-containing protein [Gemmatimonadota bacterium]